MHRDFSSTLSFFLVNTSPSLTQHICISCTTHRNPPHILTCRYKTASIVAHQGILPIEKEILTDNIAATNTVDEDEIDYEDDDIPATLNTKTTTTTTTDANTATSSKASEANKTTEAAITKEAETAEPAAATKPAAEAATSAPTEEPNEKTEKPANDQPLFSQHLPPTNAKSEAEKRALRAERFGLTVDKESEEAKKKERAERFGLPNDQVAAIDSALPDRPRKRGRGNDDKDDAANNRGNKRQSNGAGAQSGGRPSDRRPNNRHRGRRHGGGNNQKSGGGGGGGGGPAKKAQPVSVDPAEKAKMAARAERFKPKN